MDGSGGWAGGWAGDKVGMRESRCTLTRKSDKEAIRSSSSFVALEAARQSNLSGKMDL